MAERLLPPSATALELKIEQVTARASEIPVPLAALWNPQTCPAELLPWLAWALSVDEWDAAWADAVKRQVTARSAELHRRKGTVWSVREAIRTAGYADAEIEEGLPRLLHDGSQSYAAAETYGAGARWGLFKVIADLGEEMSLTGADVQRLVRLISRYKPISRHLREISYRATVEDSVDVADATAIQVAPAYTDIRPAGRRYDGSIQHDQAVPLFFDGRYRYDSHVDHDGRDELGETYANQRDGLQMDAAITPLQDSIGIDARHDGRLTYSGFSYGAVSPATVDAAMPLTVTRHIRYDNRHRYGGTHYDASASHDGALAYFSGIYHAGDIRTQEAVL
tara:strand:+ start:1034 stop:2044 length:1011 start_codon:yes stop_codon:yes gene_type:complete